MVASRLMFKSPYIGERVYLSNYFEVSFNLVRN